MGTKLYDLLGPHRGCEGGGTTSLRFLICYCAATRRGSEKTLRGVGCRGDSSGGVCTRYRKSIRTREAREP